jgi:hypothetical protein
LAALLIIFIRIPELVEKPTVTRSTLTSLYRKLDLFGFVLFASAAIMFLLALEWGGNVYSWDDPRIIGQFCGAGVVALIFIAWEYRSGDNAMIPGSILNQRVVYSVASHTFA